MLTPTFGYANDFDPAFVPRMKAGDPEYAWELVTMFPAQGTWTEEEYLRLTDSTNRLIEFTDGFIEFLPMPTESHQNILLFLMDVLRSIVTPEKGKVMFCGLRVKTGTKKFREPDLVFLSSKHFDKRDNRYWSGADLAIEIVSPDDRSIARDYEEKVAIYAAAGIAEYWIVDPQESKITVLTLPESKSEYAEHGVFRPGETATSKLLDGFVVDVKACFDAAKA